MRVLTHALALVGALACGGAEPESGPSFAYVRGLVTTADGSPVAQATVVLQVTRLGDSDPIGVEPASTDALGRYEQLLAVFVAPFDGLLDVRVTPPDTTALRSGTVLGVPIRFGSSDELDTVQVNVTLQPT
jgi:hypothetical protein